MWATSQKGVEINQDQIFLIEHYLLDRDGYDIMLFHHDKVFEIKIQHTESSCVDPATTEINIDGWVHKIKGKKKDDFVNNPE